MHQNNECEEQCQRERMNENRRKGSRGCHSPLLTYHSFQKTFSHNFARQHTSLLPPRLPFIHQQALTEHLLWAGHRAGSRLQRWITHGLHPQGTTDLLRNGHRNEKSGKSSKRGNCQMLSDFILGYNNFFTHRCCGAGDCMWGWLVSGSPWCLGSQPGRHKAWADFLTGSWIHLVPGAKKLRVFHVSCLGEGTYKTIPCCSILFYFPLLLTVSSGCGLQDVSCS